MGRHRRRADQVTAGPLPDESSDYGQRVRTRLRDERVIWFTTTGADGTPQPNPVWFVWRDPDTVLIYSRADAHRLAHIAARPRVALHFDGNGEGGDIVVLTGTAHRVEAAPAPHQAAGYLAKYGEAMTRVSGSPETFSTEYPVAVEVVVDRVRGF
jgi:PPOX class probable F420-dependent enzyme